MVVYKEFAPPEPLNEFIKCFWILKKDYDEDNPVERVLPDSYIECILSFGSAYYSHKPGDLPDFFMLGLLKEPLHLRADGTVLILCARFYPWGLLSFFDFKPRDTINTGFVFDLPNHLSNKLNNYLHSEQFDEAVRELSSGFLERYVRLNFERKTVNAAAQILYRERGACRIQDVIKICNTTRRTLERNFNENLGMSPKSYALNVRFDKAKKAISHNPFIELTELAHALGYYDQAHFIKEFKAYCGCTPSEFAESVKRMSQIFDDRKNVVFLQLTQRAT